MISPVRSSRCWSWPTKTKPRALRTRRGRRTSAAWRAKRPKAAELLAVDDVLVDSMRGRSSTWTRIRVNLRHVPEDLRPPQETPDPDDDPTREWREWRKKDGPNKDR